MTERRYPPVESQPSFPAIEAIVLERWKTDHTFEESVNQRAAGPDGANEFVFYDGPPFANGLPHYGHLLTGYVKDAIPRYRTMKGQRVDRRFGWDCHGLPAEVEAEKQLGISGHPEVTEFGIEKFNDYCRTSVLRYTNDWERYVNRQARWVDFENDYKTLDLPYMESVMWAFKTLHDKGLIYEGFRVLAYCWRCETPLSNTETRMDDVYRDRQDPAVTVKFSLATGEKILAWTTTPWTLPSNLALAVNPDIDYAVVELNGEKLILAEARLASYERELGEAVRVGTLKGSELVGRTYTPLFNYFSDTPSAFQVLGVDFVTTEDGTGVVHMAPGFGEDDQIVCLEAGIETICPMDSHGCYTAEVSEWAGIHVFEANPLVIKHLKQTGVVLRHDSYDHSYPHCWRCAEPLVYRAISSWFVEVTAVKDRMLELNQQITWVPEHLKEGSFGKWLANARDWSISRNRFWGSPIPVWKSDDPTYPRLDVYGSLAEIERDFGVVVTDLHRPAVDDLVRPNPDDPTGQSMMRRVPEVLDCWFESGSMPFAQVHYPFENTTWFEQHYPGDFIVEYIGQTRGWFYTLHVLATALFDRPAFSTCVSHGIVLGDDGQKMSKSLRNYPDPMVVFDTYGADAMRWYLLSSAILRGSDFSVTEAGIRETVRQVLLPMWNSWYFLSLYANAEGVSGTFRTDSTNILDRYILAKSAQMVERVTHDLDVYDLFSACSGVRDFLDVLTNWYIRRSRDRFWEGDQDAIDTLHTILEILCRVSAPMLPLLSDTIYSGLTGDRSVHLTDWPTINNLPNDVELVRAMDRVREVCSVALSIRKAHSRRVRLPLSELAVSHPDSSELASFIDIIADEVNVKKVTLATEIAGAVSAVLQVIPGALGPRLGGRTQDVIKAVKSGNWRQDGEQVFAGDIELFAGEYTLKMVAAEGTASSALGDGLGMVTLDIEITPELAAEGTARDLIRLVQQARREADLEVSDRIELTLGVSESVRRQVQPFIDELARETLAQSVHWGPGTTNATLDDEDIHIGVVRVDMPSR
jgi:isoleucyl-tRNA synthetase